MNNNSNNKRFIYWIELLIGSLLLLISSITVYTYFNPWKNSDFTELKVILTSKPTIENLDIGKQISFHILNANGYEFIIPTSYLKVMRNSQRLKLISVRDSLRLIISKNDFIQFIKKKNTRSFLNNTFNRKKISIHGVSQNSYTLLDINTVIKHQNENKIYYLITCSFCWAIGLIYLFLDRKLIN